jgi:hypothetical protein
MPLPSHAHPTSNRRSTIRMEMDVLGRLGYVMARRFAHAQAVAATALAYVEACIDDDMPDATVGLLAIRSER